MSSGTVYSETNAAVWINEVWSRKINRAAYHKAKIYPLFEMYEPLHGGLHIPKHDNLTATTAPASANLGEPAFSALTETDVDMTPIYSDLNVSLSDQLLVRAVTDPKGTIRDSIEMSLAQKADRDAAALFPSLTTNIEGSYATDIDLSTFLSAQSKVLEGGGEYVDDGKGMWFVFGNRQSDSVLSINNFINAQVRGDGPSAVATGMKIDAYGVKFIMSGNLSTSGGGYNNCLGIPEAFAQSWNKKFKVEVQRHGKAWWLLGGADYSFQTVRDAYACLVKSRAA